MLNFQKSSQIENERFFNEYVSQLSSRYDDFLEDHILNSTFYNIIINNNHCGYFSIFNETMLTQFYITKSFLGCAQIIFKEILNTYGIKDAFVPTCDELFLSLCMDHHQKVNLQAYFFEDTQKTVQPASFPKSMLKLATLDELDEIIHNTGDFVDKPEEKLKANQLYILRDQEEFLGLGIRLDNKIMKDCQGIGMYTCEKHRQKGVGRSIILHLKELCYEDGKIPLPGCWYYNYNSKKTLESAGFVSRTRLLRIDF